MVLMGGSIKRAVRAGFAVHGGMRSMSKGGFVRGSGLTERKHSGLIQQPWAEVNGTHRFFDGTRDDKKIRPSLELAPKSKMYGSVKLLPAHSSQ